MTNLIAGAVLLLIVGAAVAYMLRAKRSGVRCIGCPSGRTCPHARSGGCSCSAGER